MAAALITIKITTIFQWQVSQLSPFSYFLAASLHQDFKNPILLVCKKHLPQTLLYCKYVFPQYVSFFQTCILLKVFPYVKMRSLVTYLFNFVVFYQNPFGFIVVFFGNNVDIWFLCLCLGKSQVPAFLYYWLLLLALEKNFSLVIVMYLTKKIY